jgi:hypothetical protein
LGAMRTDGGIRHVDRMHPFQIWLDNPSSGRSLRSGFEQSRKVMSGVEGVNGCRLVSRRPKSTADSTPITWRIT